MGFVENRGSKFNIRHLRKVFISNQNKQIHVTCLREKIERTKICEVNKTKYLKLQSFFEVSKFELSLPNVLFIIYLLSIFYIPALLKSKSSYEDVSYITYIIMNMHPSVSNFP